MNGRRFSVQRRPRKDLQRKHGCEMETYMSKEKAKKIVAAGHVCLDITPGFLNRPAERIGDLLKPGTLIETGMADVPRRADCLHRRQPRQKAEIAGSRPGAWGRRHFAADFSGIDLGDCDFRLQWARLAAVPGHPSALHTVHSGGTSAQRVCPRSCRVKTQLGRSLVR